MAFTPLKMNYEQYLKSTLKTNIKSFDVDTTGKKPIYATMIQPIINIDYIPVIQQEVSPRQQAVNTVIEELKKEQEKDLPFDITKHVEYLNQLGVDINDFEESDMMIEDTSKLANIFKIAGNLNILQEKAIRTFIAHSIASKIPIDYKSKVSENKIRAEVKSDVDAILGKIKVQLSNAINAINKQDNSDGKYNSLIEAYSVTLKNLNDVQGNFNDIYDKGYADVQKQTQLTTIEEKEEEDRNDDVEMTVKALNKESIEESGKSKASYRLRRFLHSIPKYDINGKQETGYLGFPSYMSFTDVFS